ncbi:MAG: alpha-ketoglutarate-dependent dioxygenase AlkB [Actinomycetota bacterium]
MCADLAWQQSLFDGGPPRIDVSFAALERLQLDETSWIDYCPGWLSGSDELFAELLATANWGQRQVYMYDRLVMEPRLTAGFSTDIADESTPDALVQITDLLSRRYALGLDRVWVNLYRDGSDSVAWHGDRNAKVHRNPLVTTVSLGARRKFQLRPKGTTKVVHTLLPGHGDLVVMGGACQHDWEHTVPKVARAPGARMSVTIRHSRGELLPGVPAEADFLGRRYSGGPERQR